MGTYSVGAYIDLYFPVVLPYIKNPEQHPSFQLYFSKEWSDAFVITLHNFFSTLFACMHILLYGYRVQDNSAVYRY